MLGVLTSLAKAAVSVATVPVAVVADAVTLGGSINDKKEPYTVTALSDTVQNLKNAANPNS